MYNYYL